MNNITIETLSPVHIGSGRTLQKNIDFIFFSHLNNKPIAIIDEEKIFNLLGREKLNQWMRAIEEKADILPMLRQQKPNLSPLDIHHRISYTRETNILKGELYEHIHNASAKPYIPGSSLKGAIRTAVLTALIQKEKLFVQNKGNLGFFNSRENRFEYRDSKIIKHFIADDAQKQQQNKDFFRLLHIGDADFQRTEAIMVNTYCMQHNGWQKRDDLSQWTECIPKGEKSSLRINFLEQTLFSNKDEQKVQYEIKNFIGKNYIHLQASNLFQTINRHTICLLEKEISFIKDQEDDALYSYADRLDEVLETAKQCNHTSCVLRVGKHSGYWFMTGGWQEELLDEGIYREVKRAARRRSGYENFPLPKTRRFTGNGSPVGFVKLSIHH
jgi:CRISPR type III-A-associated RAMP protein Csm5